MLAIMVATMQHWLKTLMWEGLYAKLWAIINYSKKRTEEVLNKHNFVQQWRFLCVYAFHDMYMLLKEKHASRFYSEAVVVPLSACFETLRSASKTAPTKRMCPLGGIGK